MTTVLNRLADSTLSELSTIIGDIANPDVGRAFTSIETLWAGRYKNRTANPDKMDQIVKDLRWSTDGKFGRVAPDVISQFVFMVNIAKQWDEYLDEAGDCRAEKDKRAKRALNTIVYDGKTLNEVVWEVFEEVFINSGKLWEYNSDWNWEIAKVLIEGRFIIGQIDADGVPIHFDIGTLFEDCSEYVGRYL